jgi:hypothetical protein
MRQCILGTGNGAVLKEVEYKDVVDMSFHSAGGMKNIVTFEARRTGGLSKPLQSFLDDLPESIKKRRH